MFDFLPGRKWEKEKARIKLLKSSLTSLGEFPRGTDVFDFAVNFLNITSKFQDNGYITHAPKALKLYQDQFNSLIKICGRNKKGINRTVPGQTVNLYNTWWGEGLYYCHNSAHWKYFYLPLERPVYNHIISKDKEKIIEKYVTPFCVNNINQLLNVIEKLLA